MAPCSRAPPLPPRSRLPPSFFSRCPSAFLRGSTDSALTCQGTRAREALCVDFFLTHSRTYFSAAAPFLARPPRAAPEPSPDLTLAGTAWSAGQWQRRFEPQTFLCCRGPSLQLAACSPGGSWRPGGTHQHFLLLDPFCSGALRLAVSATPHHFPPGAPAGGQLLVPYLAQAIYRRGLSLPTPLNITGCPQLAVSSGRPPSQIFLRLTPAFPTGNKKAVCAKACHTALPACPFAYRCNTLPARPACQPANMSRASRSDTPDRGLRAPRSPMSVSSTSTPPQAPPAGDATPPAPAGGDAEHCCVCLERLTPAAQGAQLPVPFPRLQPSLNAFGVPGAVPRASPWSAGPVVPAVSPRPMPGVCTGRVVRFARRSPAIAMSS